MLNNVEKNKIDEKIHIFLSDCTPFSAHSFDVIKFATEDKGFLVQSLNMGDETSGMLLYDPKNYVAGTNSHKLIVIKRGLPEEKIRFVVAHELGHFCLSDGSSQLAHRENETIENDEEIKAEYFARSLLMPKDSVLKFVNALKSFDNDLPKEKIIKLIATMYNVTDNKAEARYKELFEENINVDE